MANITKDNYQTYLDTKIGTHIKTMRVQGGYPSVQAYYGIYDEKLTAYKTLCLAFGDFEDPSEITAETPCTAIPRGFTVAIEDEENNTVVEYQFKKVMPSGGYTMADLEVKGIADVSASDVSYGANSNVKDALDDVSTTANNAATSANSANTKIGSLTSLHTTNKTTVVDAINEVKDAIPTSMSAENVTYSSSGSHTVGSIAEAVASETTRAQAAEADRYSKSETYTKEEVHNLITTPSQEYVSVTATAQTTAVTDVLPVTGAADTTYRVGNWDGTQYNDSVFSEYAWNGSAYIKLSTKSQIGEVYDISANHANTKYADLATALGTNGANVPSAIRKGGMSIKFVQSSDNNYVQYFLIKNTWSTSVSDWQKVNYPITEDSTDLGVLFIDNRGYVVAKFGNAGLVIRQINIYDPENDVTHQINGISSTPAIGDHNPISSEGVKNALDSVEANDERLVDDNNSGAYFVDPRGKIGGGFGNDGCSATVFNVKDSNGIVQFSIKKTYDGYDEYATNPLVRLKTSPSKARIFRTWGIIGASFESGYIQYRENGTIKAFADDNNSWGKMFGRTNGVDVQLFSIPGCTMKGWCTGALDDGTQIDISTRGWTGLNAADAKQVYIVNLSSNDLTGNKFLGTLGDADTDIKPVGSETNTYVSWMASIIQRIRSKAPSSFIFLANTRSGYDNVVTTPFTIAEAAAVAADVASKFDNVFLLDMYQFGAKWGEQSFKNKYMNYSHPNANGYVLLADQFNTYIDYIINTNPSAFRTAQYQSGWIDPDN